MSLQTYYQEFEPAENLKHIIQCFWYHKRAVSEEQSCFEVIPDGHTEIIFHFGDGLKIYCNEMLNPLPSPFIMGLQDGPVLFYIGNTLEIIGVRCYPWVVFDLLNIPPGKGIHILDHPVKELDPDLAALMLSEEIETAVAKVQQYFLELFSQMSFDNTLSKAGAAIRTAKGSIPVHQVADSSHSTIRTLERKFKKSSGHTVKDMCALIRFEQVRNELMLNPDSNLAGLAYELGYADQSHLTREFKRYAHMTPAAFARKSKKDK
ncbi:helix-turn-helix domain-containing protein [uncultured Chryseobacterium sp.]|uniref:helix-turn-helix domain-containing protein n=1 Tax=uncultured Chryseobacterium sp. TaxID=259322 RepID=UPI0025E27B22|nr:helix-turn-helix domain-containing protein [uncultured Chryseobacterium sp.]